MMNFFEANRTIFFFLYGLVFFELGLAVALQSRTHSRLDLARSLKWLALFGILHGLYEWGDIFIPIQSASLTSPIIRFLKILQLILLAISFSCLLEFGVALLPPFRRSRWLYGYPLGLFITWSVVCFFILLPVIPNNEQWYPSANALARYCIGFPGAVLAAFGLKQQIYLRIAPLGVPAYVRAFRLASFALLIYGLTAGLIPPRAVFFPANLVNIVSFQQLVGVPPLVFRSLIGLVLAVAIIRGLEIFDIETGRIIESLEQQQILTAERDRIGRELHDGAIQKVYTASLLVDSTVRLVRNDSENADRLERALTVLNDAISDMRRSLSELRPSPGDESLQSALQRIAEDPRFHSLIDIHLETDLPEADSLSPFRTDHILAIVSEAISNAVRHGRAKTVHIIARCKDSRLFLAVEDDGIGLPIKAQVGYGFRNMRDRARLLGGSLDIAGQQGKGTQIRLFIPWSDMA